MGKNFNIIKPENISANIFDLIANQWGLLCAGNMKNYNMMTISWGLFGELWHKKIVTVFVRPQRYTYEFMEHNDYFTINFFSHSMKNVLELCGNESGKNIDKMGLKELTPVLYKNKTVFFEESNLIIICKKVYTDNLNPDNFLDNSIMDNYPKKNYHKFYMGEIIEVKQSVN